MQSDPTIHGGFIWALHSLGELAFRWVPATVTVITGTAPDVGAPTPVLTPITQPLTTADFAHFLQTTASSNSFDTLYRDWTTFVVLSIFLSLLFSALIIYCVVRIFQVRRHEEIRFAAAGRPIVAHDISRAQLRWNRILEQIHSDDEQQWRLAILEGDILLNELLDVRGYKGETMADKMKLVERADWKTIDQAWEAHRMRNTVAHQGSLQQLTDRDARRTIALYEQVFREFHFID